MKKALLVISILSIIFLAGCGLYNLNYFVMPDDLEFITMIESLNTPEKIAEYMQNNFTYEAHPNYALDPYTLWKTEKGDCNDFDAFARFVANWHGYETYQIKIYYSGTFEKHLIAVYVEDCGLSFTDNWKYHCGFNSFREIVEFDCEYYFWFRELKKYIVLDYENNIVEVGYNYVH
jgi:hypothetical protein